MLIIGLGNPGSRYAHNRHNVGFQLVDALADYYRLESLSKFSCEAYQGTIDGTPVRLIKPQSFMNVSGVPAAKWVQFYKIPLSEICVIHDDIELALGKVRMKIGGGTGGHNGLKSLDAHIGKDYHRLRIGVGRPLHGEVADFVLQNFTAEEQITLEPLYSNLIKHFPSFLKEGAEALIKALLPLSP